MDKATLSQHLERETQRYLQGGGEVIRYASPQNPTKIKLGAYRPIHNLKEEAWRAELDRLRQATTVTTATK